MPINIIPVNPLSLAWAATAARTLDPPDVLDATDPQGIKEEARALYYERKLPSFGILSKYPIAARILHYRGEHGYVSQGRPVSRLVLADGTKNTYLVAVGISPRDRRGRTLLPDDNIVKAMADPIVEAVGHVILHLPYGEAGDPLANFFAPPRGKQELREAAYRELRKEAVARYGEERVSATRQQGEELVRPLEQELWLQAAEKAGSTGRGFYGAGGVWADSLLDPLRSGNAEPPVVEIAPREITTGEFFGTDAMIRSLARERWAMRKWFADNLIHPTLVSKYYDQFKQEGVSYSPAAEWSHWPPPSLAYLAKMARNPIPASLLTARFSDPEEIRKWERRAETLLEDRIPRARTLLTAEKVFEVHEDRKEAGAWYRAVGKLRRLESKAPTRFPIQSIVGLAVIGYGPTAAGDFGPIEGPVIRSAAQLRAGQMPELPRWEQLSAEDKDPGLPYAVAMAAIIDVNELRTENFKSDDPTQDKPEYGYVGPAMKAHRAGAMLDDDRRYSLVFGTLQGDKFFPTPVTARVIPSLLPLLTRVQLGSDGFVPWSPTQLMGEQLTSVQHGEKITRQEYGIRWGGNIFSAAALYELMGVEGTRPQRALQRLRDKFKKLSAKKRKSKADFAEMAKIDSEPKRKAAAYVSVIKFGVGDPDGKRVEEIFNELMDEALEEYGEDAWSIESDLRRRARQKATSRSFVSPEVATGRVHKRAGLRDRRLRTGGSFFPPSSIARLGIDLLNDFSRAGITDLYVPIKAGGRQSGEFLDEELLDLLQQANIRIPKPPKSGASPEEEAAYLQKVDRALGRLTDELEPSYVHTLPSTNNKDKWEEPYDLVWSQLGPGEPEEVVDWRKEMFSKMNPDDYDGRRPRRPRRERRTERYRERKYARENTWQDAGPRQGDILTLFRGQAKPTEENLQLWERDLVKPSPSQKLPPAWAERLSDPTDPADAPLPSWESLLEEQLPKAFPWATTEDEKLTATRLDYKDEDTARRVMASGLVDRLTDDPLTPAMASRWEKADKAVNKEGIFWTDPVAARTITEKAGLSVPEAQRILQQQHAAKKRYSGKTVTPSTALIQPVRVRRLKEYGLDPVMHSAMKGKTALILTSPQPLRIAEHNPREFRVMSFRRGTHIDLDLVPRKGLTSTDVLALALQSALYWLAQDKRPPRKNRRNNMTLYLGRVGEPYLFLLWSPGMSVDPTSELTLQTILSNIAKIHRDGVTYVQNPPPLQLPPYDEERKTGYNAEADRNRYLVAEAMQDARRVRREDAAMELAQRLGVEFGREPTEPAETAAAREAAAREAAAKAAEDTRAAAEARAGRGFGSRFEE